MFARDRDLLVLEPGLMRDVAWNGQRVLNTTGVLNGDSLALTSGSWIDAGVGPGFVVAIDGVAHEIVSVQDATFATVSLIRASGESDPVVASIAGTPSVVVHTFSPQIGLVHRQVLAMLGIDPDDPEGPGAGAVLNPGSLVRVEALGALHLIYASAAAPGRGGEAYAERAERYKRRFGAERGRVSALIDLDGDGVAETRRHPNAFVLTRG